MPAVMRLMLIIVMVGTMILVPVQKTWACSCMMAPEPLVAAEGASAVFSGRVEQVTAGAAVGEISSADPVQVWFAVDQVWKGDVPASTMVVTSRDSASCGFDFQRGGSYVVYAFEDGASLSTNLCSRTAALDAAGDDLAALGAGYAPIPVAEEGGTLWVPIALGVAATALALAGVLVWQSRRRPTVA